MILERGFVPDEKRTVWFFGGEERIVLGIVMDFDVERPDSLLRSGKVISSSVYEVLSNGKDILRICQI